MSQIWRLDFRIVTYHVPLLNGPPGVFWDNYIYYRTTTNLPNAPAGQVDLFSQIGPILQAALPYSSYIGQYGLFWISGNSTTSPQGLTVPLAWSIQGPHITTLLPMTDTVTIQRRDGHVGRPGRGRFTWGPITTDFVESAVSCTIDDTHADLVALADMLRTIYIATGVHFVPQIRHHGTPATFTDVVSSNVSKRLTMLRNRRLHIPSWT